MDFPDSLYPSIPIILHSQQALQTTSSVCTELIGWPTLAHLRVGIHWRTSPISSTLLFQLCLACLTWMVFEMGGRWPYSCCFVGGVASRICSKLHEAFLCSSHLAFSPWTLLTFMWCIHTVVLDTATAWKKSCFLFSDRSGFHIIDNLSIAVHIFARHILSSLLVDEILLPMYVNLSTNFRGLPLCVEMDTSGLKHMYSILFVFMWKPMPSAAYSRLCNRDSAWTGVFARSSI